MRKSKICVSILLVIALLTFSFLVMPTAMLESTMRIFVEDVNADAGQIVNVPVKVENNVGVKGLGIIVNYDSDVLEPISVTKGSLLSSGLFEDSIGTGQEPNFEVFWVGTKAVEKDGELFNVSFSVKESANKDTTISITIDEENTFDKNLDLPLITSNMGTISITPNPTYVPPQTEEPTTPVGTPIISVDDAYGVVGEEMTIPVSIQNNPGISCFKLFIDISDKISIEDILPTELLEAGMLNYSVKNNRIIVLYNSSEDFFGNGTIFEISFIGNAKCKTNFNISYSLPDTINEKLEEIEVNCIGMSGVVTTIGDMNADLNLTISDATMIQWCLAKIKSNLPYTENIKRIGDINRNSVLDIEDVTKIQQILAHIITGED